MPNDYQRAAGTVIRIDGVIVGKITSFKQEDNLTEEDVTTIEDLSGALVQEKFITVSIGSTADIEGILFTGAGETVPQDLAPGQQDLRTKMRAGTACAISHVKPNAYGHTLTGFLTQYSEGFESAKGVYDFSAKFRINSRAAITP